MKKRDEKQSGFRLSKARAVYLLVGIWALAVLARVFLFTGYMNGDMGNYIQEAVSLWDGNYSIHEALSKNQLTDLIPGPNFNWQNLRIGLVALDGLSMKIFGVNDFSYAIVMFGFFSLAFFMTYAIGTRLESRAFGVLAAGLFAFIAKEINLTTILVPHLPADALMALSCYFLIKGLDNRRQVKSAYAMFFLSGVAVGTAYLFHELSMLLLPVLALMFWARMPLKEIFSHKEQIFSFLLVLAGFGMIFLAEQIYFFETTGVMLLRLKFISVMGPKWLALNPIDLNTIKYNIYPRAMFFSYDYGIFYYLFAAGLGTLCYKFIYTPACRSDIRKTHVLPLIWFSFIFLYLQFGSTSLTTYKPVFKLPHYLSFISVPAALLASILPFEMLSVSVNRLRQRDWGAIFVKLASIFVLIFFASSSVLFAWVNYTGNGSSRPDITNEKKITSALQNLGDSVIYTDIWTKHGLDFAYGYKKKIVAYNSAPPYGKQDLPDLQTIDDGLVVVNWIYLKSPFIMAVPTPRILQNPPGNWHLVRKISRHKRSIEIYKVEDRGEKKELHSLSLLPD